MPKKEYEWKWGETPPKVDEHTKIKHLIYHDYIIEYIKTLNKDPRIPNFKFTVVDAFAGGGNYTDGSNIDYRGSPLKIWDALHKVEGEVNNERKNEFILNKKLYLIEKNRNNFKYLKKYLTEHELDKYFSNEIELINDDFIFVLNRVIDEIKRSPGSSRAIFILDQYGYSSVPFNYLALILELLPNAEIILTFSIDDLINYIPYKNPEPSNQKVIFKRNDTKRTFEQEFTSFLNTCSNLGLDGIDLHRLRTNQEDFRTFIQHHIAKKIQHLSKAKHYDVFLLHRKNSHKRMMLVHLAQNSEAINVMKTVYGKHSNNSNIIINHKGGLGMDIFGFKNNRELPIFGNDYNFHEHELPKVKNALLEELPATLHGREITVKDFYNERASDIVVTKAEFIEVIEHLVSVTELEIIKRKSKNNRPTMHARKVQMTDTIALSKQGRLYFTPKF